MNPALPLRMRCTGLVNDGGKIVQFNFRKWFQLHILSIFHQGWSGLWCFARVGGLLEAISKL
jgi:hypothetical protein